MRATLLFIFLFFIFYFGRKIYRALYLARRSRENEQQARGIKHRAETLQKLKAAGAKKIRVLNCNDARDCQESEKMKNKKYSIKNPPLLPCKKCDAEYCRCTFIAVFEDDD